MHLSQVLRAKKKREEVSKTYINKIIIVPLHLHWVLNTLNIY